MSRPSNFCRWESPMLLGKRKHKIKVNKLSWRENLLFLPSFSKSWLSKDFTFAWLNHYLSALISAGWLVKMTQRLTWGREDEKGYVLVVETVNIGQHAGSPSARPYQLQLQFFKSQFPLFPIFLGSPYFYLLSNVVFWVVAVFIRALVKLPARRENPLYRFEDYFFPLLFSVKFR